MRLSGRFRLVVAIHEVGVRFPSVALRASETVYTHGS